MKHLNTGKTGLDHTTYHVEKNWVLLTRPATSRKTGLDHTTCHVEKNWFGLHDLPRRKKLVWITQPMTELGIH